MIQIESLTVDFGSRRALDTVSFGVQKGTLFGLLGPNGSGKSTCFRVLTGQLPPTGGRARIGGADVVRDRRRVREQIGVVFQQAALDTKLSVRENLVCQGHLYGLSGGSLNRRVADLLDRFNIGDRADDLVEVLSGGLRRRVEIAKAILHNPAVLLLDEPSTGLDPQARRLVLDTLRELSDREGVTCVLTTHYLGDADRCDRLAILCDGRLVAQDTPASLKATIGGDVIKIESNDAARIAERFRNRLNISVDVRDGAVRVEHENGAALIPLLVEAAEGEIASLTISNPSLDDVFLHLTGKHLDGGHD